MLVVVYDVDDVLNELNNYVADTVGIPHSAINRYKISEIDGITDEQKGAIIELYKQVDTFKNCNWKPSMVDICRVQVSGEAEVHIHSTSMNQDIADFKRAYLLKSIPGLTEDNLSLVTTGEVKDPHSKADIIVEDCIDNLLKYDSTVIKILIDTPHNQFEDYGIDARNSDIIRVKNLDDAIRLVECIVNMYRLGKNMQKAVDIAQSK